MLAEHLAAGRLHHARVAIDCGADVDGKPSYKGVEDVTHIVSAADWNEIRNTGFFAGAGGGSLPNL